MKKTNTMLDGIAVMNQQKQPLVDRSDLKHVQDELWKEQQAFKAIAENSPDIIARVDKAFRHVYINPQVEIAMGITAADFIGRTLSEIGFDSELCNLWYSHIRRVFKTGQSTLFEGYYQGMGRAYYYQTNMTPEFAPDGSVAYVLYSIRNMTTIKEAEKALRNSEANEQRILDAFPDLLFLINKSGLFLDYQAGMEALLYIPPEEFLGKRVADVLPAETSEKIMYHIERAIMTSQIQIFDYQLMVNKSLLTFEARIVWAKNDEVLFIVRDITKLKQLENSLARLDRLNTVGEMAAGIAHELRNPMTTVRGFLQILSKKNETSCFKEQFTLMIDELDRANSIITEYLSLAKNKVVQLEYHNLSSIVESLAPLIQADAAITGKRLNLMLGDTADLLVDHKEVRQLLLNLTRNGLESMQPGTMLTIKTYQENDEVFLVVQDQGAGIRKEILEKLGTPFFTTKDTGTGLGMAICYSIAARHDAVISIATSSAGTSFSVCFKSKSIKL